MKSWYSIKAQAGESDMVPFRGGNWNNGGNAGVSYVSLDDARSISDATIGALPDFDSPRTPPQVDGGTKGGAFRQAARLAKSAFRRLFW